MENSFNGKPLFINSNLHTSILDNVSSTYEKLRVIIQLIKVFDSNRFHNIAKKLEKHG